jgi:tRNA G18 (ribose-2'-O)-methylase SpoU
MQTIAISDPSDERVRDFTGLTDVDLRKLREPAEGLFIAEGEKVIRRALKAGLTPRSALMTPRWIDSLSDVLPDLDCPIYVADEQALATITGYTVHRGALMSLHRPTPRRWDDLISSARRVVILEDLVDHTNVGAIFRNAAALGVEAVLVTPACADPLYRRSIKVSMATVFAVPWARIDPWPSSIGLLRELGFHTLAMTPDRGSIALQDVDRELRLAVLVGTEGAGLSAAALEQCDVRVRIPMSPGVDSLNVSAATAITFYALGQE